MKIYLEEITGFGTAVSKMYVSLKTWTPELGKTIKIEELAWRKFYGLDDVNHMEQLCEVVNNLMKSAHLNDDGKHIIAGNDELREYNAVLSALSAKRQHVLSSESDTKIHPDVEIDLVRSFENRLSKVFKIGKKHITLLRFIDFAFMIDGLHRGGTDDFDSHAERFDNRIIRMSTRTEKLYGTNPKIALSDYYNEKIIPFGEFIKIITLESGVDVETILPLKININDKDYVRTFGGYVLETEQNNPDVLRGMIPLAISNVFGFKSCITEFAHVVKMRDFNGDAHEEIKIMVYGITKLLNLIHALLAYDLWEDIIQ